MRDSWISAIRTSNNNHNFQPNEHSVVCSEHFLDSQILNSKRPRLIHHAVPSIFRPWNINDNLRNPYVLTSIPHNCSQVNENETLYEDIPIPNHDFLVKPQISLLENECNITHYNQPKFEIENGNVSDIIAQIVGIIFLFLFQKFHIFLVVHTFFILSVIV